MLQRPPIDLYIPEPAIEALAAPVCQGLLVLKSAVFKEFLVREL